MEAELLDQQNEKEVHEINRVTWIGIVFNLLLSGLKFYLGLIGRSQAVVADAIHSLSDLTTDFAILFGVQMWSKPADKDHPYGHRKIETMVTIAIGIALFSVAFAIGARALIDLKENVVHQPNMIALAGAILSIILKEIVFRWTLRVGKKAESSAVIANAWHHRSDAISSIPVALAVFGAAISKKWYFLDYLGALVVSLFIIRLSWTIVIKAVSEVIETGASDKILKEMKDVILSIQGVKSVSNLRTRRIGGRWFVDLDIKVDPLMPIREGHQLTQQVKKQLLKEGPNIIDVVVHMEPFDQEGNQ